MVFAKTFTKEHLINNIRRYGTRIGFSDILINRSQLNINVGSANCQIDLIDPFITLSAHL